jgi:hypothetical protein
MSPLFGKSEEKKAHQAAAEAEVERLNALPAAQLARELMPAFGSDGPRAGKEINSLQASAWLMRSYPQGGSHARQLHRAVCEGIACLERAGLVEVLGGTRGSIATGAHLRATRVGDTALADGSVAQHLDGTSAQ